MKTEGAIIALAWPETKVIHEGKWYDTPMRWLGFLKEGYYTAGHAALVLVDFNTCECKYYDFGRYHTPPKFGRVRSYNTDPELKLTTKAKLKNNKITNIQDLLTELQNKKACHGDGELLASIYDNIDYPRAVEFSYFMQERGVISYGPFVYNGTNCSRFVAQTTKYSTKSWIKRMILSLPYTVSPSPKFNIRIINSESHYYIMPSNHSNFSQANLRTETIW